MKCPYCDSTFEVSALKDQDSVLDTPAPPTAGAVTPATEAAATPGVAVGGVAGGAGAGAGSVATAATAAAAGGVATGAAAAPDAAAAAGTTAAGTPAAAAGTPAASDAAAAAAPTPAADWQLPTEQWEEGETADMRVYTCSTCAGQIVGDATLGATSCPYCGNPVIMTGQFSGALKPNLIIPFHQDKAAAQAALLKHYEGKPFLPKYFKSDNHVSEIKGVYVPFWLFDATTDCHCTYKCENIRIYSDGRYQYTETSSYSVERQGTVTYSKVPVDGSAKVPDALMESIEPFDYSALVDFQTAYLAGYYANIYDVEATACIPRAEQRMSETSQTALRDSVSGYTSIMLEDSDVQFRDPKTTYALLPVWMLSSVYKGQTYSFAMNGQTGRLAGDLPVDPAKYRNSILKWGALTFVILLIAAFLIFVLPTLLGG